MISMKELCILLLAIVVHCSAVSTGKYKVVCYVGSWANHRPGDAKFTIEHIDPNLCTHAIYAFAKLEGNKITVSEPYLDLKENWGLGAFSRFNNLKKINPKLKTLIAIGGWNEGSQKYSVMASNAGTRAIFVQSAVEFCQKHGFDGLDVDWEYPANRGGAPQDKANFVALLKELKKAFAPHGLLLTAAVSAGKNTVDTAYDIPNISKYLDFINVMAYDLHASWKKQTSHNSPLYARDGVPESDKILTIDYAITYWNKQGAPLEKLILGMGFYGRSFTLANARNNGLGAPTTGPGKAGPMTKESGMLGYNEICLNLNQGWTEVFAPKVEAPYAYSGDQWIGYDNKKSIGIKVDYIIKKGLGGGMVWSLETDDFRGKCDGVKYPLLSTIYNKLNGEPVHPTLPPDERVTIGTTVPPSQMFKCTKEGYFRDPSDCSKFLVCVSQGQSGLTQYPHSCGHGLAFDESIRVCNHREQVSGC